MYCTHTDIENNKCLNCGIIFKNKNDTKISKKINFEKELLLYDLPLEIKQWVVQKSSLAQKRITRMGCRSQILFAYLYLAYIDLGYENFMPEELMETLKISKKNVGNALKLVSGIGSFPLPQYKDDILIANLIIISPIIYLKKNLTKLNKLEYYDNIYEYMTEKLKNNELLYEENPNLMCISFIKNYFDQKTIKIVKFHTIFNKTQSAIKKCIQKINLE